MRFTVTARLNAVQEKKGLRQRKSEHGDGWRRDDDSLHQILYSLVTMHLICAPFLAPLRTRLTTGSFVGFCLHTCVLAGLAFLFIACDACLVNPHVFQY